MERLQKYIASCGIASRRKAEELITEGKVQVNGRKVTELGVKINPQKDKVKVNGKLLAQEKPVYYLLNKPKGVITSVSDPQGRETVLDYIKKINDIISSYNLVIKGKPNTGIKVVGLEKDIRIFILENINDSEENFIEIANFLNSENIRYDKIQLNTIDRVGAERDLKAISFDKILKVKEILEENGLHNIEIIKSLNELEENQKIQVNQELLDNMKQKRLYQEEEINKIFKKT